MNKVKALTDESGHWYLIPNELVGEFNRDSEDGRMIDSGEFDDKWGKYMTGGDLNRTQLYVAGTKTLHDWLKELPEPYSTQAINNTPKIILDDTGILRASEALMRAFDWENSPEGYAYWMDVWCTADGW